jgi:alkylation response protein AidB-like acyl-CoA dehydrogenase
MNRHVDMPVHPSIWSETPDGTAIRARFRQLAEQGLLRHALPTEYNGLPGGFASLCQAHRQLGAASLDTGLLLTLNAHLWGMVFPILLFGNAKQRQQWLPKLLDGSWLAGHAITEPNCGSDVQAMTCLAESDEHGFLLNGEKRYITNAPLADWLVVYAKHQNRISAFLLKNDDPGCHFTPDGALNACSGSATGSVILHNCRLNADRLLGKNGAGTQILQKALEYERSFIFAGIAGILDWQLQTIVEHSRNRRSFGVHLGRHQAISHRIAEMKLRLDTIDLWINKCTQLADTGQRLTLASAQTKLYAGEAFLSSCLDALHILGAAGLESDNNMSRLVHDALASRLFSGSSEIQKNLIAALLGTGDGYRCNS